MISVVLVFSMLMTFSSISVFRGLFISEVNASDLEVISLVDIVNENPKTEYLPSDTVYFTLNLDQGFDFEFGVYVIYRVMINEQYCEKMFFLENTDYDSLSIKINIDNSLPNGYYELVKVAYTNGGSRLLFNHLGYAEERTVDLSGANFTVNGSTGDSQPPVVTSVSTDVDIATIGDIVNFDFGISDASLPAYISLYFREGVTGNVRNQITCEYNEANPIPCPLYIEQYTSPGVWELEYVSVYDSSFTRNFSIIYNKDLYPGQALTADFSSATFTVEGTIYDVLPPVFNNLSLSSNNFHKNELLTIDVDAIDQDTQIEFMMVDLVDISSGEYKRIFYFSGNLSQTISLLDSTLEGECLISELMIRDIVGNELRVVNSSYFITNPNNEANVEYIDLSAYNFYVSEVYYEDLSNVLIEKIVSPKESQSSSDVQFTLITDGSLASVDNIKLYFNIVDDSVDNDGSGPVPYATLFNNGDGTFSGNLNTNEYYYNSGTYYVKTLEYIQDGELIVVNDSRNGHGVKITDMSGFEFYIGDAIDYTPPILDSIEIDKHFPMINEIVNFNIMAHDDESEICNINVFFRIDGQVTEESIGMSYGWTCGYQEYYGKLVTQFEIPGLWEVDSILIRSLSSEIIYFNEKFHTYERNKYDFSEISFTISGTTPDIEAPRLISLQKLQNPDNPLDVITFNAEFSDDMSGVDSVFLWYYNENQEYFVVSINANNASFGTTDFKIPSYAGPGLYKIGGVQVRDFDFKTRDYGNSRGYDFSYIPEDRMDLSHMDLVVERDTTVVLPPQLIKTQSVYESYITGTYANINFELAEITSLHEVDFYYMTPQGLKGYFWGFGGMKRKNIEVSIPISTYGHVGQWTLVKVIIRDNYGNQVEFVDDQVAYPNQPSVDMGPAGFKVFGRNSLPRVDALTFDKEIYTGDQYVGVTLDLSDNIVKPDEVVVYFKNSGVGSRSVTLALSSDGNYVGNIYVSPFETPEVWSVQSIDYTDRFNEEFTIVNTTVQSTQYIAQDLSSVFFSVEGTTPDTTAPEINDITIEEIIDSPLMRFGSTSPITRSSTAQNMVYVGATLGTQTFSSNDRIRILVDANDDVSGLDHIRLKYKIYKKTITFDVPLTLNADGLYEGEISIKNYYPEGLWILVYFEAVDLAGNSFIQNEAEISNPLNSIRLTQLQFNVEGTVEDSDLPFMNSLTLSSKTVEIGDVLYFSATVGDLYSGVESFEVVVASYDYLSADISRKIKFYLMDDGSYQGELPITENLIGGEWGVKDIYIYDRAGNKYEAHSSLLYPYYIKNKVDLYEYSFLIVALKSAEITKLPNKLVYRVGEEIDLSGMEVLGRYNNNSQSALEVSEENVLGFDSSVVADSQLVYVLFGDTYVSFNISITDFVDDVPPVITIGDYETGWTNQDITVCAAVNEGTLNETCHLFTENGTFVFKAIDENGNTSEETVSITNIDKIAPVVHVEKYLKFIKNSSVSITYSASDSLSGMASESSASIVIDTSKVGEYRVYISATDNAGNITIEEVPYKVIYQFTGFLQPINSDGSSVFKAGSTIPVKFRLTDSNLAWVDSAIASLTIQRKSSSVQNGINEFYYSTSVTSSDTFRYSKEEALYILNFSTKGMEYGLYTLVVTLDDGEKYSIDIGLRK